MIRADCPKRMTYGPCGGVRPDGRCEIGQRSCAFLLPPLPVWNRPARNLEPHADPPVRALTLRARLRRGGMVVADFPARALDAGSLRRCAAALSDVDAVLIGDTPRHRVQFPPSYRARLLQAAGATAWVGLNARDRNRVALEGEIAALADLGTGAVHCVTGNHPALGSRPDAAAVFDVDSTELTAMAAGRGPVVSVAESPAAPPVERRPARLRSKEAAGAEVCFVNHCGGVDPVTDFIRRSRSLGCTSAMIACVPLVGAAGIDAAVELGGRMLDTGLLSGVNLSGGPADGAELPYAEALAETAQRLRR